MNSEANEIYFEQKATTAKNKTKKKPHTPPPHHTHTKKKKKKKNPKKMWDAKSFGGTKFLVPRRMGRQVEGKSMDFRGQ